VASHTTQIAANTASIVSLTTTVNSIAAHVTQNTADIITANASITTINTEITSINTTDATQTGQISTLQVTVASHTTQIAANTASILKLTAVAVDSTATGSSATLGSGDLSDAVIRLTNVSLTSMGGISAGVAGQRIIIENQTGSTFNVNNQDATVTAANRIFIGAGANIPQANNVSFEYVYDATAASWMFIGLASNAGTVAIAGGGTGQTTKTAAFDALQPMTTGGDMIAGGASGTGTRVANGTLGQLWTAQGGTTIPAWATPASNVYWNGHYPSSASNNWSLTSSSIADFTVNGTIPSPTMDSSSGFGTVSKATSNLPGVNFSAPRSGLLKITIDCSTLAGAGQGFGLRLVETTTATTLKDKGGTCPTGITIPTLLVGFLTVVSGTTYNVILRGLTSASSLNLNTDGSFGTQMEITLEYKS
jgi:hypothetical protein